MNVAASAPVRQPYVGLLGLAAISLGAAAAAARSPISLDILQRDGYGSVELHEGTRNTLYLSAKINGEKIGLLLDTGWGSSGITVGIDPTMLHIAPEKGGEIGESVSGVRIAAGHGTAKSVEMGNVRIEGAPIFFGRFAGDGFVGFGFLKKNNAIIDLTNLRLYLRPPGTGRRVDLTAALTAIGMSMAPFAETARGNVIVNVEVNGVPAKMALDTGAQVTVLDARFAKAANARGWGRRDMEGIDAAGVASSADFAGTKTFKIEGIPIRTPTVILANYSGYTSSGGKIVGLLGLDVIGLNWGIMDFAQRKFYFMKAR